MQRSARTVCRQPVNVCPSPRDQFRDDANSGIAGRVQLIAFQLAPEFIRQPDSIAYFELHCLCSFVLQSYIKQKAPHCCGAFV